MTRTPLVTVVIPTYRRARVLARAVRSALRQTYPCTEVIVVDDASGDGSDTVVETLADPRVRFLRHAENRGACAARNTGIRAASGELVAFLDSDDEWLPGKIERQVAVLARNPDVGLVYSGFLFVAGDGRERAWPAAPVPPDPHAALLANNFVGGNCVTMARRRALEEVGGFDETLPSSQDHDLWIRVTERWGVAAVDEALARVHMRGGGPRISSDPEARLAGTRAMLAKHGAAMRAHGVEHLYLRGQARFAASAASGDLEGARRWYLASLRCRPTALATWAWFAASYLPRTIYEGLGTGLGRVRQGSCQPGKG